MQGRTPIFLDPFKKFFVGASIGAVVGTGIVVTLAFTVPASVPALPFILGGTALGGGILGCIKSYRDGRNVRNAYQLVRVDDETPAARPSEDSNDPETDVLVAEENAQQHAQNLAALAASQAGAGGSTGVILSATANPAVDESLLEVNPFALADAALRAEQEAAEPAVPAPAAAAASQSPRKLRVDVDVANKSRADTVLEVVDPDVELDEHGNVLIDVEDPSQPPPAFTRNSPRSGALNF